MDCRCRAIQNQNEIYNGYKEKRNRCEVESKPYQRGFPEGASI